MSKEEKVKGGRLANLKVYILTFSKWLGIAVLIGGICGLIGTAFYKCVAGATALRAQYPWLIYGLPLGGLMIVGLYRLGGMKEDPGTDAVLSSVHSDFRLPFTMAPLIFISTTLTHLFGGSAGREGAALQIGGSVGVTTGRLLKLPEEDHSELTMCGMSALFSALFGTPITAMIFSMEVISVGIFHYGALVPCMLSSLIALLVTQAFGIQGEHFVISQLPQTGALTLIRVMILAALCALLSIVFCVFMHRSRKLFKKLMPNPWLRAAVGGVVLIGLTLLVGSQDYNGAGMQIVEKAIEGEARPEAFALKLLFTMITLGCGFKGGEIVPSFFIGATFGCVMGSLLGLPPGFGAAIGLISVFCGAVNCPLASMILSVELFGADRLLLFGISCAISYALSGYFGLYGTQKILYSKIRTKYINRFTE